MMRVTWEWLGQSPALDLANTVAVVDEIEHDLIASHADYERWARSESRFAPRGSFQVLERARPELLQLRTVVRQCLADIAADERPEETLAEELNRVSRRAPQWLELHADGALALREESSGSAADNMLARYARSVMQIVAGEVSGLRRCPAPSCGMFYLSSRDAQRWCSTQCGTRARVARHYNSRRGALVS